MREYEKQENYKFSNEDAGDVLAPALFRGGVRGRRGSSSHVNIAG